MKIQELLNDSQEDINNDNTVKDDGVYHQKYNHKNNIVEEIDIIDDNNYIF